MILETRTLILHSRLKRRGDRAFSVIGPRLWNDLPVEVRMAPSLTIFKSLLKNPPAFIGLLGFIFLPIVFSICFVFIYGCLFLFVLLLF